MTMKLGTQGERSTSAARLRVYDTAYSTHDNEDERGPGPAVMGAKTLTGDKVFDADGGQLGTIEEIMLDTRAGRIAYAVMSFGGFLGMGDKLFAVPWDALELDTEHKGFVLRVEKDRLESAPGFDKNHWPAMADPTWAYAIHEYYESKPYWAR